MIQLSPLGRRCGRVAFVIAVVLVAAGCASTNENRGPVSAKLDYGKSLRGPLEVPPDLVRPAGNDTFTPPAGASVEQRPLLPDLSGVRLERAGAQRWLVVGQPPEKVWPAIDEFLKLMGLPVAFENRSAGIVETEWAQNLKHLEDDLINRTVAKVFPNLVSAGLKDKYRIRIEPGASAGETDVYLTHRGLEEVSRAQPGQEAGEPVWQPRPSDPELEAEMLRMLMLHLGLPAQRADGVLATPLNERARLEKDGAVTRLVLEDDDPERAWRRVGVALDGLDVIVEARDRARGIYTVRYNAPEKEGASFFSKVFEKEPVRSTGGEYQLVVSRHAAGAEVTVTPGNGGTPDVGAQILTWLQQELK